MGHVQREQLLMLRDMCSRVLSAMEINRHRSPHCPEINSAENLEFYRMFGGLTEEQLSGMKIGLNAAVRIFITDDSPIKGLKNSG